MKAISLFFLVLVSILLCACNKTDKNAKVEKQRAEVERNKLIRATNISSVDSINQKYAAISGWDTLEVYTYELQEMLLQENRPISFEGRIIDITIEDSTYFIKVYKRYRFHSPERFAKLSLTPAQFEGLKSKLQKPIRLNEGCFIFNFTKIKSSYPSLATYSESDGEVIEASIVYDYSDPISIFEGELVAYYLDKI